MATITNKTRRALSVPLPGGKKLRLGPLKTGEITPKALDHPPVLKLIEAGEVEVDAAQQRPRHAGGETPGGRASSGGQGQAGSIRQSGDR